MAREKVTQLKAKDLKKEYEYQVIVTDSIDAAISIGACLDSIKIDGSYINYIDLDSFETRRKALLLASKNQSIEISVNLKNYIIIWANNNTFKKKVSNSPIKTYYQGILESFEITDSIFYEKLKNLVVNPRCKGLINLCENTLKGFWQVHAIYLTLTEKEGINLRGISYMSAPLYSLYSEDILSSFKNMEKVDSTYYENKAFIECQILQKVNSKNTKNLVSGVLDLLFKENLRTLSKSKYKILAKLKNLDIECSLLNQEKLNIESEALNLAILESLKKSSDFKVVAELKEETLKLSQYNLVTLLSDSYIKYGYSYTKVMRILTALFYSGYITSIATNETRTTDIESLETIYAIKENLEKDLKLNKRETEQKVDIVRGRTLPILPTKKVYTKEKVNTLNLLLLGDMTNNLPDEIFNIYFLIVSRFLDSLSFKRFTEKRYILENTDKIRCEVRVRKDKKQYDLKLGESYALDFTSIKVDIILEAIIKLSPLFSCSLKMENIKDDVVQGIIGSLKGLDTEITLDSASSLLDIDKLNEYFSALLFSETNEFKLLENERKKAYLFETIGMLS